MVIGVIILIGLYALIVAIVRFQFSFIFNLLSFTSLLLHTLFSFKIHLNLLFALGLNLNNFYNNGSPPNATSRVEQAKLYEVLAPPMLHPGWSRPNSMRFWLIMKACKFLSSTVASPNLCTMSVSTIPLVLGGIPTILKHDMLVNMLQKNHIDSIKKHDSLGTIHLHAKPERQHTKNYSALN